MFIVKFRTHHIYNENQVYFYSLTVKKSLFPFIATKTLVFMS
ncbi:Uncharacterized protein YR821_0015 [Yersinia ruckeri]|uniref:Uncharacterized protein n=1 Tax=Yersinia ruckeri TaxID=29486 RepID=A0A0A8V8G5_YERRU|nr:hypothetical protein yruck0001_29390 [Yersinia ruckeri ATCC 29473]QTD74948.1 Uncharacterized protein YR821_0015 [Yersinia ruckeri]CEK25850.1 hypothetical protein CSF007_0275 [Yersinia ruckeri]